MTKEKEIKDAVEKAEKNDAYEKVEDQTGELELEEEILEEDMEIPDVPVLDIPQPKPEEDFVQIESDGKSFSELTNYEKIKMAAAQNGVSIKDPNPSCNKCNGTGIVSIRTISTEIPITSGDTSATETVSEELPNPCRCIFKKEDLGKMFTGKVLLSRKLDRIQYKQRRQEQRDNNPKLKKEKENRLRKLKAKKLAKKRLKKKHNKR